MGLFEIENKYIRKGYHGKKLVAALKEDKEYQRLLKVKRHKIRPLLKTASPSELKKYVLSEKADFVILDLIHKLEKKKLNRTDKRIIELIKAQLEHDWRRSLIRTLRALLRKYSK